jgi:tRNA pseudouridine55 synthase
LLDANKTYEVVAAIGVRTDTADADGRELERSPVGTVSEAQLEAALAQFRGDIMQVPPMYSALKKDGRRLYELARAGQEVERAARPVTIHELTIQHFDPTAPRLRVHCSKGTYVRTLVEDIAAAMGTLAHVAALRRTAVEPFGGQSMVSVAALEALGDDVAARDALLLPVDAALQAFPAVHLDASAAFYLGNGHAVRAADAPSEGLVRLYEAGGSLLGIGEVNDAGEVAPKRLFPRAPQPTK